MELTRTSVTPLRALITECLPYELPLEMNTHWLYAWFADRAIRFNPTEVSFRARSCGDLLLSALIGAKSPIPGKASEDHPRIIVLTSGDVSGSWRAPASFVVRRDSLRTRELDMLALGSQLAIAFLYAANKDSILYFTNRDRSSLRHPWRTNAYGKQLSSAFRDGSPTHQLSVETLDRRLGTYNSFFVYEKYAFVGQFYDSKRWHALEAHWRFLRRLDVSNCFKSIYTHSFAWSTGTDSHSKAHLGGVSGGHFRNLDLGRAFDKVMQSAKWGETHGICVGPEASRVFAEVIFQNLDIEIRRRLHSQGLDGRRYEILRYVDDYFIYSSDELDIEKVAAVVELVLRENGFSINESKTKDYVTPFTTSVSVKKATLKLFLKQALPYKGKIPKFDSREIGVHLKQLLIDADNDSAAVGTSLTHIERRLRKFIRKRAAKSKSLDKASQVTDYAWDFVHNMLYQYLSHPSVASSMKVVRALRVFSSSVELYSKLSAKESRVIRFKVEEAVGFGVTRALGRLAKVAGSEIEICNFLSLASASGIRVRRGSKLLDQLVEKSVAGLKSSRGAKSNQAGLFLMLATLKYFLGSAESDPVARDKVLELCHAYADHLLDSDFIPTQMVQSHASQELFVLSILGCPFLTTEEKTALVSRPWLLDFVELRVESNSSDVKKAARRFVRRCAQEGAMAQSSYAIFDWTNDLFDKTLYEKEPQFIY